VTAEREPVPPGLHRRCQERYARAAWGSTPQLVLVAVIVGVWIIEHQRAVLEHMDVSTVGLAEQIRCQRELGGTGSDDVRRDQDRDIRQPCGADVVGGEDDDPTAVALLIDHLRDHLLGDDVQARDRFVQQEDPRALREALRHVGTLPLATGQLVQLAVAQIVDAHPLDRILDRRAVLGCQPAHHAAVPVGAHPYGLEHGQGHRLVRNGGLEHMRDGVAAVAALGVRGRHAATGGV